MATFSAFNNDPAYKQRHIVGDRVYEGESPSFAEFQADHAGRPVIFKNEDGVKIPLAAAPGYFGRTVWLKIRKGIPWRRVGDSPLT